MKQHIQSTKAPKMQHVWAELSKRKCLNMTTTRFKTPFSTDLYYTVYSFRLQNIHSNPCQVYTLTHFI